MTDVIQRIDIWAQSLCRELRQKSCLVPYSVMIEVIQAVGADLPPPPGEAVPPAVKVKPLEWVDLTGSGYAWNAINIAGIYGIRTNGPEEIWLTFDGNGMGGRFYNLEDAKAAAQADFERRILSALANAPSPGQPATEQPDVREDHEALIDEIEDIISETHDIDVTDRKYAENIVGWLQLHHPAALRALEGGE